MVGGNFVAVGCKIFDGAFLRLLSAVTSSLSHLKCRFVTPLVFSSVMRKAEKLERK